jgi:hypothetical protein
VTKPKPPKKKSRPLQRSYGGVAPSVSRRDVETMFENAKVVGQLNQELFSLRKEIAAEKTSVEFWIYEATRWRKEAEELRREEAMARVQPGER